MGLGVVKTPTFNLRIEIRLDFVNLKIECLLSLADEVIE